MTVLLFFLALRASVSGVMSQVNAGPARRSREMWGRVRETFEAGEYLIMIDRADIRIAPRNTVRNCPCSSSQAGSNKTLRR